MKKLLGVMGLLAATVFPPAANASLQTLSNLFVFGDSLSDGGNSAIVSQAATGGAYTYPPAPYYNGRYSNGPVAVEYLWNSYNPGNTSFKPSLAGGTNYAIGGATSGLDNYNSVSSSTGPLASAYNQLGTNWQLGSFAAGRPVFDPATSLFVVWQFPNDVFYSAATGKTPGTAFGDPGVNLSGGLAGVSELIANGIGNIVQTVAALAASGAQHFLVPNMPNLGATPEFAGNPDVTALSLAFNANLKLAVNALDKQLTSAEIVQFDTATAFQEILDDPAAHGITNTSEKCVDNILNGRCNPNDNTWMFWDGVHPTTYAHGILGARFAAAVPEPETIFLLALGLLGLVLTRRKCA